jgi:hypothetical protein
LLLLRAPRLIVSVAALLSLLGPGSTAFADTIVKGRVLDPTTESGITGAQLKLRRGATELALATTDVDGYFELVFPFEVVPEQRTLALIVESERYSPDTTNVIVTAGRPDSDAYAIELTPVELARCRRSNPHVVMVGYFSSLGGGPDVSDLSRVLVTGLSSNLLPELQKRHLPEDFQPIFDACPAARPSSPSYLDNFARALGADVFIFGDVLETGPAYRIRTYVGDRYSVFEPPRTVVNENVAVTDPAAAELDRETHAYMLVALANGYAKQERFAECVDVCVAAEQVLGDAASPIVAQREFCQERTGNSGLIR